MKPKTLQQAVQYFADPDNCLDYMASKRWPDGVVTCPTCGRNDVTFLADQRKWQCKSAHSQAPVLRQGRNHLRGLAYPFGEVACRGMDGLQLQERREQLRNPTRHRRDPKVGMVHAASHPFRNAEVAASECRPSSAASSEVEVDETWIGGKAINMHKAAPRSGTSKAMAHHGKIIVMGMLDRDQPRDSHQGHPQRAARNPANEVLSNVKYGTQGIYR